MTYECGRQASVATQRVRHQSLPHFLIGLIGRYSKITIAFSLYLQYDSYPRFDHMYGGWQYTVMVGIQLQSLQRACGLEFFKGHVRMLGPGNRESGDPRVRVRWVVTGGRFGTRDASSLLCDRGQDVYHVNDHESSRREDEVLY